MERMTKRLDDGQAAMDCQCCPESWINIPGSGCTALYCRDRLKDRVAAYEDTGLEPQEIERIVDAYGRGHTLRTESAERLEIIREIPTDRLRELVEADQLIGKEIWAKENTFHMFWKDTGNVGRAGVQYVSILKNGDIFLHTQTCAIPFREIGKTVFLNRDSAKAALKEDQDG